jgi:hypothetical protein
MVRPETLMVGNSSKQEGERERKVEKESRKKRKRKEERGPRFPFHGR